MIAQKTALCISAALLATLAGCATEDSRAIVPQQTAASVRPYAGVRQPISVGKFDNRSSFMRGVFTDGADRLGADGQG